MINQPQHTAWTHGKGMLVMPIKPLAQKAGLRSSTQLSASEVLALLDENRDSVSTRWTARAVEIMQRPVAMPHLAYAAGVVFVDSLLF